MVARAGAFLPRAPPALVVPWNPRNPGRPILVVMILVVLILMILVLVLVLMVLVELVLMILVLVLGCAQIWVVLMLVFLVVLAYPVFGGWGLAFSEVPYSFSACITIMYIFIASCIPEHVDPKLLRQYCLRFF